MFLVKKIMKRGVQLIHNMKNSISAQSYASILELFKVNEYGEAFLLIDWLKANDEVSWASRIEK